MFEKVNPQHPDKVADRIAGAIVDLCYTKSEWPKTRRSESGMVLAPISPSLDELRGNPKVAAEVLLGHGLCSLQIETSERLTQVLSPLWQGGGYKAGVEMRLAA